VIAPNETRMYAGDQLDKWNELGHEKAIHSQCPTQQQWSLASTPTADL